MLSVEDYEVTANDSKLPLSSSVSSSSSSSSLSLLPSSSSYDLKSSTTSVLEYILSAPQLEHNNNTAGENNDHDSNNPAELIQELSNCLVIVRETIDVWRNINLNQVQNNFHDNVIELTENRDEYLKKRKLLVGSIRNFTSDVLAPTPSLTIDEIQERCKLLIEEFKSNFDNLSSMCKKTETSYLDLYKLLREAADPVIALSNISVLSYRVITTLQTTKNSIQKLQTDLLSKEMELTTIKQQQQHQQQLLTPSSPSTPQYEEKLQTELQEIKSSYEKEFKKREQLLRDSLEKKYLELMTSSDRIIAQKDFENQQLHDSLLSTKQLVLQSQEEHEMYLIESDKRQHWEQTSQRLTVELEEMREKNQTLRSQIDILEGNSLHFQKIMDENKILMELNTKTYHEEMTKISNEKKQLEGRLSQCPPIDFKTLLNKLGLVYESETSSSSSSSTSTSTTSSALPNTWGEMELYLQNEIRRFQQIISELQTEKVEIISQLKQFEEENGVMKDQINQNNETIIKLERDLSDAFSSIEAGKALLKCHKIMNTGPSSSNSSDLTLVMSLDENSSSQNNNSSNNNNSTIIKGILNQRDRMMKLAREKETEVNNLQLQINLLNNNVTQLKQENLQLYQRIRLLRISNGGGSQIHQNKSIQPLSSLYPSSSARNKDHHNSHHNKEEGYRRALMAADEEEEYAEGEEMIEFKYQTIYETSVDVSQLLLYDQQQIFTQLTIYEKYLLNYFKFILHDTFRRHSYLIYLLAIHGFVLYYLFHLVISSS